MTAPTAPTTPPAAGPAQRSPGRAGRNLPAAIGVGVTLGGLVLGTLYSPARWTFVVVVGAAIVLGLWEVVQALRVVALHPPRAALLGGAVAMLALSYTQGPDALVLALVGTVLACLLYRVVRPTPRPLRDLAAAAFTAAYVPFLAGFAVLLAVPPDGARRVTAFIATVVCSDVGGYAAGVLFGKHPMAPSVSPKKSWEGLAGSVVACATAGALFFGLLLHATPALGAVFGLAVVASATLGDLGESVIKRDIGIKDMGTLLPGHGGVMDRLDSLLPTAPIAYLLLTAFVTRP